MPSGGGHRDGGRSWTALPVPPGGVQDANGTVNCARVACVSQIRFATTKVGYLFGPALYQTGDGGRTWHREPSRPVEALEPSAGTVVRVVYDDGGCPGPCARTVQETTAGSGSWRTLLRLPATLAQSQGAAAQLVRQGTSVIYLPVNGNLAAGAGTQHTVIFWSTDGGNSWQQLADPCGGTGQNVHDTAALARPAGSSPSYAFRAPGPAPRSSSPQVTMARRGAVEPAAAGPRALVRRRHWYHADQTPGIRCCLPRLRRPHGQPLGQRRAGHLDHPRRRAALAPPTIPLTEAAIAAATGITIDRSVPIRLRHPQRVFKPGSDRRMDRGRALPGDRGDIVTVNTPDRCGDTHR